VAIKLLVRRSACCEDVVDNTGLDELLQRAARREPAALSKLVETYSPRVFGLLYRLTDSRDVAEDLLQETFLRVVRVIGEYRHVGKFESWLFRIAANLARDRARQFVRRGRPAAFEESEQGEPPATTRSRNGDDPAEGLAQREAEHRVAASLRRLSDGEREVLVLRHYSGHSFREIAAILGIPLGTALARAHRGLQRLRQELADED
jgi:RNA polymerase sigma-70 factor (ECF subfamily)